MAYQYPIDTNQLQWSSPSALDPSHNFDQYDSMWPVPMNSLQHQSTDLDYWRQVSWDQLETEIQSPMSFVSENPSPTSLNFGPLANAGLTYDVNSSSQSLTVQHTSRGSQHSEASSVSDIVDESKIKRRRIQNRNSQRAYRERTRQREEQMTEEIGKLQAEIDELRSREKGSTDMIEALTKEIERLKRMD